MFNTSILQATYRSQIEHNTSVHVDNKQDIYPADEETKQEMIRTAVLVGDRYEFGRLTEKIAEMLSKLMRCANCGFLSKAQSFMDEDNEDFWNKSLVLDGCPRCRSKAIFMDKEQEEEK